MLAAFQGNESVRTSALARLNKRLEDKKLSSGAMFFNGDVASVSAAMIESDDANAWQTQLGLAKWLAYALDYGSSNLLGPKAVSLADRLFNAIPAGSDTALLGSKVILAVLEKVATELTTLSDAGTGAIESSCEQIKALHARAVAGAIIPPADWRAARKSATTATNGAVGAFAKALGACVEAAAWDPAVAPTTVGDVIRLWNAYWVTDLETRFGFTPEHIEQTRTLLQEMHNKFKKDNPEEQRDVFMLLREHHPEVEARLLSFTQFQRSEAVRVSEVTAQLLVDSVGASQ